MTNKKEKTACENICEDLMDDFTPQELSAILLSSHHVWAATIASLNNKQLEEIMGMYTTSLENNGINTKSSRLALKILVFMIELIRNRSDKHWIFKWGPTSTTPTIKGEKIQ